MAWAAFPLDMVEPLAGTMKSYGFVPLPYCARSTDKLVYAAEIQKNLSQLARIAQRFPTFGRARGIAAIMG
jgi:hypothetical protein